MFSRSRLKKDVLASRYIPYMRHVDDQTIELDSGALMVMFEVRGINYETVDNDDLLAFQRSLLDTVQSVQTGRLCFWMNIVRHPAQIDRNEGFSSYFAGHLNEKYETKLNSAATFTNRIFLTLLLFPSSLASMGGNILKFLIFNGFPQILKKQIDHDLLKELEDIAAIVKGGLARYGLHTLTLEKRNNVWFSRPLEILRFILFFSHQSVVLPRARLGDALFDLRVLMSNEVVEIRDFPASRHASILSLKAYPSAVQIGCFNSLLKLPLSLSITQSFAIFEKDVAYQRIEFREREIIGAEQRNTSSFDELTVAFEGLQNGDFCFGDHHLSVAIFGDTPNELINNVTTARQQLADIGGVFVAEDVALDGVFFGQLPGNVHLLPRVANVSSATFFAYSPLHQFPQGDAHGAHWEKPVAILTSSAKTAYFFNFHSEQVGNTFICGPTGSGKTVLQCFLLAQLEKLNVQRILFDKDRGSEIFIRACGGEYFDLRNGEPTNCAPLKTFSSSPKDLSFLSLWVKKLLNISPETVDFQDSNNIDQALSGLMRLPKPSRTIEGLRGLLRHSPSKLPEKLTKWVAGNSLGWVFDAPQDKLALENKLLAFDMSEFLDNQEIRAPLVMVLFERILQLLDGRRLLINIDEFWKVLDDPDFSDAVFDWLKTIRKKNGLVVLGTQSPADALNSKISRTVIEQCATHIFLPNPKANRDDYCGGFSLSTKEFDLIKNRLRTRQFLIKQGHTSGVAELDLAGLNQELAVLSGTTSNLRVFENLDVHGHQPESWLPQFFKEAS